MKNRYLIPLAIIATILQTTLLQQFRINGVMSNLIFMMVIVFSILFSGFEGIRLAIIGGLMLDLVSSRIIGLNTIVFFIVAVIIHYLRNILYSGNYITPAILAALSTFFYYLTYMFIGYFLLEHIISFGELMKIASMESIFNILAVIIIYKLIPKRLIIKEAKREH